MSFPRRFITPAIAAAALLAVAGCSSDSTDSSSGDTVSVLASFYPLQFVAEQIGGEHVSISNLTPPGAEPHDLELSPKMSRSISSSDLVVYLSNFQPSVDEAIEQRSPQHVIDAAASTDLLDITEYDDGETEEHEGHDHGTLDPHFWLDPDRLAGVADKVTAALVAIDPDNAATYRENAAAFRGELTKIDDAYTHQLATCGTRVFVTSHEAFGYLAERYDLQQVGITGIDPEGEPSPARIKEVKRIVTDNNINTIFFETAVSPKVATTLANDLGLEAEVLDPIETLPSDATTDTTYFTIMRANLDALEKALMCS